MIKRIINYIKSNKLYIISMVIGTLLLMLQMKYVVLYADDLSLGIISKQGIGAAFKHLFENYMNWGGGPTPFIAIIFLMFKISVWKIFNCAMIVITIILTVRMITYNNKINKGIVAICMWALIYTLNIYISSETIYWLDGNLAYVLTAFQMIIYFYYLYSRIIMKTEEKKYDYILLPIFAFFAGWSGPQAGALTVIIPIVLYLWKKIIDKENVKKIYIISWVIALIGFLVYFLAPGNAARSAESFPEFTEYNIVEKILYRVDSVWNLIFNFNIYRFASIPFYLYITMGFMSVIALKIIKEEKQKVGVIVKGLSQLLILFLGLNYAIYLGCNMFSTTSSNLLNFQPLLENLYNGTFSIKMLAPYIITSFILIISVILSYYISCKQKNPLLVILFSASLLGQGMMLLSPYSPLRSTFITVILLWMTISYLLSIIIKEKINIIGIFVLIIAMMYDIKTIVVFSFIYYIFKNVEGEKSDNKKEIILIGLLFCIMASSTYMETLKGYSANQKVYHENISRIEKFKENKTGDNILYLKESIDSKYGFNGFVGIEWIETAVKQYFELDEDVILKYEEIGGKQ